MLIKNRFPSQPEPRLAMPMMAQKRWPEAARLFRVALSRTPDPALWMQYGHALRESGFLEEAGVAYSKAQEGIGPTLDMHIQLGHWNKLAGRFHAAVEQYADAGRHPDAGLDTKQELRALLDPLRRVTRPADNALPDEVELFFSCVAPVGAGHAPQGLGRANYSYGFAMRGFQGWTGSISTPRIISPMSTG
jgi:Flp pilus assembly protein TadD